MRSRTVSGGARRHLISLANLGTPVADGDGSFTETATALSPATVWASVKPATAKDLERVASGTVLSTATHIVTMPYHAQVSTTTRIVFGTRSFNVTGVSDPEERHIETICVCVELVGVPVVIDTGWIQSHWLQ
jgi:SPP1 family predicted phage head-tail adaptor